VRSYNPSGTKAATVHVEYGGMVTLKEPVIYKVGCPVNMMEFPYDVQVCTLAWSSWEYNTDQMNIVSHFAIL
jgi:hypothetical protein